MSHLKFFICPGAQKAGTTTLYDILKHHSQICLSNIKETKYFLLGQEKIDVHEYKKKYFNPISDFQIYGDIDPEYLYYPDTAKKIYNTLGPDVKFIFMLRNPVDRAYSHYWMSYRRGFETESFERAIELESERLKNADDFTLWHQTYMDRGYYYRQIERYLKYYDVSQMKFVLFEEFIHNQGEIIKDILDFLGVDQDDKFLENLKVKSNAGNLPKYKWLSKVHGQPLKIKKVIKILFPFRKLRWKVYPIIEKYNVSNDKPPKLDKSLRKKIIYLFSDDIKHLEQLINKDRIFGTRKHDVN